MAWRLTFKAASFYKTFPSGMNRSEYVKEYSRLRYALKYRINNIEGYIPPKSYSMLADKYARTMSNEQLFKETQHLYNILKKSRRFDRDVIAVTRDKRIKTLFKQYNLDPEKYGQVFEYLDNLKEIYDETLYDSSEALDYFSQHQYDDTDVDDLITTFAKTYGIGE